MISRDVACRVSDIVGTSFLFGTRNESIMFRVPAPFGGSGKRKAVSTGDKTMTGVRCTPPLGVAKIAGRFLRGDKTMA